MKLNVSLSVTSKKKKKDGLHFAADLAQLQTLAEQHPRERVVLGGQLMLCALEPIPPEGGWWVVQPGRPLVKSSMFKQGASKKLNCALQKESLEVIVKGKLRAIFAIDSLLKYGYRLTADESLVVSALEGTENVLFTALHFRKGELQSVTEYAMGTSADATFEADAFMLFDRLRLKHPAAVIHWCGPLDIPCITNVIEVPQAIWAAGGVQTLNMAGKAGFLHKHGMPLGLAMLGVVAYAAAMWVPYSQYRSADAEFSKESSQLTGQFIFASERLQMLQTIEKFYQNTETNTKPLNQFTSIVNAVALTPNTKIKEANINWPSAKANDANLRAGGKEPYDFEIVLEVPRQDSLTALEQSVAIVKGLSERLGMNLRIASTNGVRESTGSNGESPTRVYRIQGDFIHV